MKELPKLSIIVITHNRLDYTQRTLDSLLTTTPGDTKFVINDNCSDEAGMQEYLKGLAYIDYALKGPAHQITVLRRDENRGWGVAVNEALNHVDTEFILISNNDCVYEKGWYEKLIALYEKYPKIGIMGVWQHIAHGTREDLGDLLVKDDMPAVGWLLKRSVIDDIGPFAEHGPCLTKGGNGEDVNYTIRAHEKGYLVACPKPDVANHIDGY